MTGVWKYRLLLLVALGALVGGVMITRNRAQIAREMLGARVSRAIEANAAGDTDFVDFATLAEFPWDRLYVFRPYTSCERVLAELGTVLFWYDCGLSGIDSYAWATLIVFTRRGAVVSYLVRSAEPGDFSGLHRAGGYARTEARFQIAANGMMEWIAPR